VIESGIPLQVRGFNFGELSDAYLQAQAMGDQRRANKLQQTLNQVQLGNAQIQLGEAQDDQKYKKTLNGLLQVNTEDTPGGLVLNEDQTISDLNRLGYGQRAIGLQSEFRKNRTDLTKQKRQEYLDRLDTRSRILDGATAEDYTGRLQRLRALGDDLDGLPRRFDAQAVKGHLDEVLSRKEKLEQMGKDAKTLADKTEADLKAAKQTFETGPEFQEKTRHNKEMENVGRMQAEATAGAKEVTLGRLPDAAVNKLSEIGGKVDTFSRLLTTANPNFFGANWANKLGNNFTVDAMRTLGVGLETVNWWQDYDSFKNEVRHGLFGGALTPGEKSEFEKTVVTPRMAPELAQRNLQRQYDLARKGAERLVKAYEAGGYNREQITAAIGGRQAAAGALGAPLPVRRGYWAPAAPQGAIRKTKGGMLMYTPRVGG
jgi:hypothetical protein